jgi:two-component system, NarL family, nitrate/nitrite response regulator NarL
VLVPIAPENGRRPLRFVLADDHSLFREALCYYLRQSSLAPEIIEAGSLGEALERAAEARPDALLLDFVMPGMDGARSIDVARHRQPGIPIVILSGNMTREQMAEAVRRGATGVISKDLTGKALVEALEHILSGESVVAPSAWVDPLSGAPFPHGEHGESWAHFNLTPREIEVVRLLARGMRNKTIAYSLGVANITVRLHLRNAFRKMGAGNRADAVRIAMRSGLFS